MPRSIDINTYGPEYEQLLLRAHEKLANAAPGTELAIDLPTPASANSLRSKVYAYWAAIRKSEREDLKALPKQLALRVAGSTLIVFRREDSWDAKALRSALGLERGFADLGGEKGLLSPNVHTAALDKLAEIRARKQGTTK